MPIQHGGELNHEQKMLISGKYELNKLTSREGSANVGITTAGGNESTFEIPTRPLNLARSVLRFTYTPAASGNNTYNRIAMDCLSMIRSIELRTRSGEYLCNLLHAGNYTKIVWKPEISYEKFMALDNHGAGVASGAMLQKCNADANVNISATDRKAAVTDAQADQAALQAALAGMLQQPAITARRHNDLLIAAGTGVPSPVNVSYEEAKYFEGGGNNSATPVINVKLPLAMLFGTIFELDNPSRIISNKNTKW